MTLPERHYYLVSSSWKRALSSRNWNNLLVTKNTSLSLTQNYFIFFYLILFTHFCFIFMRTNIAHKKTTDVFSLIWNIPPIIRRNLHQNIPYQRFRIYWSATLGLVWKGPGSSVVNDNTTIWLSIRGMVSYHFSSRSFQTWISSLHDNPYHQLSALSV